jgi:hypothetical protein
VDAWRQPGFDDSGWSNALAPFYYGDPYGTAANPGTLLSDMLGGYSSVYLRKRFVVANISTLTNLLLNHQSDDGFIAWINGVEVVRANAAGVYPAWNATATTEYEAPLALVAFDISASASLLRDGANVLAIRLLNDGISGDDALLQFTLTGESREGPPLAVNDVAATPENRAVIVDVLANDRQGSDPIAPESVTIVAPPSHGAASVNPDGTIAYTPNGIYNGPPPTHSRLHGQRRNDADLGEQRARPRVPTHNLFGTTWRGGDEPFSDASWASGTFGVGYDRNTVGINFNPLLGLNVGDAMQNVNTSLYLRSRFTIAEPDDVRGLTLRMRYDDGSGNHQRRSPAAAHRR